jgi:hypothetical protein
MKIVLRVRRTEAVIMTREARNEEGIQDWKSILLKQMDAWERSDQFIGRPLEIVTIPSYPGEILK